MADLAFAPQHNMIAYLEKTENNAEFHQIVDFLTPSSIHHSLTVSATIYASNIEQFWNTATSQTINDEKQIYAIVDGKTIEPKPDEEANNNPDERLNDNIMKSLFGCDSGATRKKEDGRKPAMVAKESPVAVIPQLFTDADVRGLPNTNKKHNVSVAVTKPSPRVRSLAYPNSVPQDGILDGVDTA
nr:nucleotide-binding alpha-beta plait domain, NTF2-like domain protein [Tanacetum cinerariifolium]